MKGLSIFLHSVRLVFRNLDVALRLSLVLYAIYAVLQIWFSVQVAPELAGMRDVGPGQVPPVPPAGMILGALAAGVAMVVISLWIVVAWHRYVILGEVPSGWVPQMHGSRLTAYFGYGILLALLIGIAVMLVSLVVIGALAALAPPLAIVVGPVLVIALAFYMFYRLCPILPAAAVGSDLTLGKAWAATKGTGGTILVLVILSVLASLALQIPTMVSGDPGSLLSLVYGLVIGWPVMLVGASVLTTFYGHYIEGRPIEE